MRRLGVTRFIIFGDRHKCLPPKWFKITTNSVIRGSSFFFNINPDADCHCHSEHTTNNPSSPLSPIH